MVRECSVVSQTGRLAKCCKLAALGLPRTAAVSRLVSPPGSLSDNNCGVAEFRRGRGEEVNKRGVLYIATDARSSEVRQIADVELHLVE